MRLPASIWLFAAVALAVQPSQSRAADQRAALDQALGSPEPLYKFTPGALEAAVKLCASNDPGQAGATIALVLHSGRNDADAIAPSLVRAAIQGLGVNPKPGIIADIVCSAVKSAPTEVLDIVTAAVKASPRAAAPYIVTAAVSTVPHPESIVTVNVQRRAERATGNDKQLDGKSAGAPVQKQLTLAEAIVQAALDANPDLSANDLTAAADRGLNTAFATTRAPNITRVLGPVIPVEPTGTVSGPGPVSP